ncbi:MAG TPA: hypothetical protein DEF43_10510 [Chloroflexus aurantiacus]|jgi:hypothetical protein|nr:MAG: hypothetical protein D6716_16395 [Chloroflexota bacterium]HBW67573.1 hypothetical protein [Chloroflexus aurantiacus]
MFCLVSQTGPVPIASTWFRRQFGLQFLHNRTANGECPLILPVSYQLLLNNMHCSDVILVLKRYQVYHRQVASGRRGDACVAPTGVQQYIVQA